MGGNPKRLTRMNILMTDSLVFVCFVQSVGSLFTIKA